MPKNVRTFAPTAAGHDIHVDTPLSNLAVAAFDDGTTEFVGDQLFPSVPVDKQSNKYYTLPAAAFLRTSNDYRAPKTKARRIEFEVSSDAYYAHNYVLANENALEDLANQDNAIMLRENSTKLVVGQLLRNQEVRLASLVTSATNLGSGALLTGTNKWSDYVNSDPIADVTTGQAFMRQQTGLQPNTALLDTDTIKVLRRHPILLDLFKYTAGGVITMDQLKEVFSVERILEGKGIVENSLEGGTSSVTNIWGNVCLLAHIEQGTGLQTRTLGLRMRWTPPELGVPFQVMTAREDGAGQAKVEVLEAGYYQAEKLVAPSLGYLIGNTL